MLQVVALNPMAELPGIHHIQVGDTQELSAKEALVYEEEMQVPAAVAAGMAVAVLPMLEAEVVEAAISDTRT